MPDPRKVLFLCTGNSCRSQMAEALLRTIAGDRFEALSAGSHPAGYIHDTAIKAMRRLDIPFAGQASKSWDEFADTAVDVVITLCDSAAAETCPVWPGDPIRAHWSLPDPAGYLGTDEERADFAVTVARRLRAKIEGLVNLDWSANRTVLSEQLARLGEI